MTAEEQQRDQFVSCQNNMKQLGLVIRMFSAEHREYVPASWRTVYPDYLCDPNVLVCPAGDKLETCYDIVFPALHEEDLAMIWEAVEGQGAAQAPGGGWESRVPVVTEKHRHTVDAKVVRNVLFYDGHVEAMSDEQWNEHVKPYIEYR